MKFIARGEKGRGEGVPGRTPLWASWQGRSGAFNTPFKFIMTFYSLCRMQQAEAGGGREGKDEREGGPSSSLISSESCSKFLRISA